MAIQLGKNVESYVNGFNELQSEILYDNPEWLKEIRNGSIGSFSVLGFPTLSDEDWRFTNLAPLTGSEFRVANNGLSDVDEKVVKNFSFSDLDCAQLVFVNGRFASSLSSVDGAEEGIIVKSLGEAISDNFEIV